jgi:hypothetical protein
MRVSIFAYLTCVICLICLVVGEDFLSPLSAPKQTIQFSAGEWKKIGYLGYELDATDNDVGFDSDLLIYRIQSHKDWKHDYVMENLVYSIAYNTSTHEWVDYGSGYPTAADIHVTGDQVKLTNGYNPDAAVFTNPYYT